MVCLVLSIILFTSRGVFAQSAGPTTSASTQPAAAVDQTTPRGALKVFFAADAGSDGASLQSVLLADGPAQQHMVDALSGQKTADRTLTDALKSKFPDQWKVDPREEQQKQLPGVYDTIDKAAQTLEGQTATLKVGDGPAPPLTLKNVNGQWRIPLASLIQSIDNEKIDSDAHQIDIQIKVMQAAATDVSSGKYATQALAVEDIKKRMLTAALDDHAASTQPALHATTQP